ncbi:hypothetical protein [Streptomyces johnsoniae]|uniref:Uncharacterized protein n=1 Tax=Streptomyces johnsoniae TaxID=3075532 RepID=A0ABU2S158_9ACTN|nr:hypothetical protein [Streptomyces sp. DSM 41886]MDT0441509.1 hypothetical protein [Streptomyces sp. DSM 41886]
MPSFDEEWAGLRATAHDHTTHTRLNSTEGGAAAPDLELHEAELAAVQRGASFLADALDRSGHEAEDSTSRAGTLLRTPGFGTGSALADVADRWRTQADTLRNVCADIASHLRDTTTLHAAAEQDTIASLHQSGAGTDNPRLSAL